MQLGNGLTSDIDPSDVHSSLVTNGIHVCPSFIAGDLLSELQAEFGRLFSERNAATSGSRHPTGRARRLSSGHELRRAFPITTGVIESDVLREIAGRHLPTGSAFNDITIAAHDFEPGPITETHFDSLRALKFLVYLTDTDTRNGAFEYAPGTHTANTEYRQRFVARGGHLLDLQNIPADGETIELTPVCGDAGTLIIFDTDGFHSAGRVTGPGMERRVLRARSAFAGQPRLHPRMLSPMWLRRKLGVFPPRVPEQRPGRHASGGRARRRSR